MASDVPALGVLIIGAVEQVARALGAQIGNVFRLAGQNFLAAEPSPVDSQLPPLQVVRRRKESFGYTSPPTSHNTIGDAAAPTDGVSFT